MSFRSVNAYCCARPGKSRDDAHAYIRYAAPVCVRARTVRHVSPQIDAGIAQKGHLRMDTIKREENPHEDRSKRTRGSEHFQEDPESTGENFELIRVDIRESVGGYLSPPRGSKLREQIFPLPSAAKPAVHTKPIADFGSHLTGSALSYT